MNMSDWDRYTLQHREHPDQVVRLHGGPHHGRIITLPDGARRRGDVRTMAPIKLSLDGIPETPMYRREKLVIYDEVDHAVDVYDYWHLAGTPLPPLRQGDPP